MKLINDPERFVEEMLEGLLLAHPISFGRLLRIAGCS